MGILGGLLTFIILPNPQLDPMSGSARIMATGLFALLYMLLMLALMVVIAFLYNIFTQAMGMRGVTIEMESADESGQ